MITLGLVHSVIESAEIVVRDVFELAPSVQYQILLSYAESSDLFTFIMLLGYFFYANYFMEGKSLGCICLNFTVLSSDNQALTFRQSLIRSSLQALYLPVLMTLIYSPLLLLPFLRKDHKGLADLLSSTGSYEDHPLQKYPILSLEYQSHPQEELPTEQQEEQVERPAA